MKISRKRKWISMGAILVAAVLLYASAGAENVVIIKMVQSPDGKRVYFDPVGVHIRPGQTVRWIQLSNFHSVTAYHPANGPYDLRIPPKAVSWDSGVLTETYPHKSAIFEYRFIEEGVYDYFCRPHEAAGMVGRIVVGSYMKTSEYTSLQTTNTVFPSVQQIISKGVVRIDSVGDKNNE